MLLADAIGILTQIYQVNGNMPFRANGEPVDSIEVDTNECTVNVITGE